MESAWLILDLDCTPPTWGPCGVWLRVSRSQFQERTRRLREARRQISCPNSQLAFDSCDPAYASKLVFLERLLDFRVAEHQERAVADDRRRDMFDVRHKELCDRLGLHRDAVGSADEGGEVAVACFSLFASTSPLNRRNVVVWPSGDSKPADLPTRRFTSHSATTLATGPPVPWTHTPGTSARPRPAGGRCAGRFRRTPRR